MGAVELFFLIAVPSALTGLLWDFRRRHGLHLEASDRQYARRHRYL